jgi:hypothetical protein
MRHNRLSTKIRDLFRSMGLLHILPERSILNVSGNINYLLWKARKHTQRKWKLYDCAEILNKSGLKLRWLIPAVGVFSSIKDKHDPSDFHQCRAKPARQPISHWIWHFFRLPIRWSDFGPLQSLSSEAVSQFRLELTASTVLRSPK